MSHYLSKYRTSKISLATLTVTAACFSLTGFAAACSSASQTGMAHTMSGKTAPWLGGHASTAHRSAHKVSPTSYDHKHHGDKAWTGAAAVDNQTAPSTPASAAVQPSVDQPANDWSADQASQPAVEAVSTPTAAPTPTPAAPTTTPVATQSPSTPNSQADQASQPDNKTSNHTSDKKHGHCDHSDDSDHSGSSSDQQSGQDNQSTNQSEVTVNNIVSQSAVTGKATGGASTDGSAASITSGDASNVDNTSTLVTIASASGLPVAALPAGTTPSSTVYYTSTTGNVTNVIINNIIEQVAVSGNAGVKGATWGGTVSSGDASNNANVVTYVVINN